MTNDLTGQVALVTGGGRGIGRAIAQALATAGAAVAVTARTTTGIEETARTISAAGGRCLHLVADATDQAAMERAASEIARRLGPVTVLVNNAGTPGGGHRPYWKVDPAAWWECIEVTIRGTFLACRAIVPQMLARGGGGRRCV